MNKESNIIHENASFWVLKDRKNKAYTVYKTGITHSVADSLYKLDADGLSIAKARANYLAKAHDCTYIITYGKFAARPQDCFAGVGIYLSAPTRELADKYKADFVARWPSLPVAIHATKDVRPTA